MNSQKKAIYSWCLYDWANSAFAVTVLAGFFPVFFNNYWCSDVEPTTSTLRLGVGSTIAGLLIAFFSLFMGAVADAGGGKKRFLFLFMVVGTASTTALYFVSQGNWLAALSIFILGNIGFSCSDLFYNSLLLDVTDRSTIDYVSSMGFACGYLGCGLLFAVNVLMTIRPQFFGLENEISAVKVSFLTVAAWWLIFSIPIFLYVKEKVYSARPPFSSLASHTVKSLKKTAFDIRTNRVLLLFICAYWLYIDGLNTFIRMAIDFGVSIGFSASTLMLALLLVQFVAFPSALVFGQLAFRFGAQKMILFGIVIYIAVTGFGTIFLRTDIHFVILASLTGLAQGGIQALSRSYFGKLIPPEKASEYFGFYNIVGRFAVLGPVLVGGVGVIMRKAGVSSNMASRMGMSSVLVLFAAGGLLLVFAEMERERTAKIQSEQDVFPVTT